MNLTLYKIWLFSNLWCFFRDVLLMCISKGKEYWDIRVWGLTWRTGQPDEFVWTRLFGSVAKWESSPFFLCFAFILNNKKKKQSQKIGGSLYFYEKNSPNFLFLGIFLLLTRNRRCSAVQNSSTWFPLIWDNLVNYSAQIYSSTC